MAFDRYEVYFSGKLINGFKLEQVKQSVAQLFKADQSQLNALFSGEAVRIKQGVDADTAAHYRATLRKIGVLIEISPTGQSPAPSVQKPSQPDAGQPPVSNNGLSLLPANTGTLADCAPPLPTPLDLDLDGMTLAAPGTVLDETPPAPPADIDISGLSAAPPNSGSLSDCQVEQPALTLPDIDHIELVTADREDQV